MVNTVMACPMTANPGDSEFMGAKGARIFLASESHKPYTFSFIEPTGFAVSNSGQIVILDSQNAQIKISTLDGKELRLFGKVGQGSGQFVTPKGLALDPIDDIYVADTGNNRIQRFI